MNAATPTRQAAIFRAVNLWDSTVTREHLDAYELFAANPDPRVLDIGDPPPVIMLDALVNGYWYVDDTGDSTHPRKGEPLDGWEYECFWLYADDLEDHGYTLADLGPGAGTREEACRWFLDAWKTVRG
jgi:hypothetical protein